MLIAVLFYTLRSNIRKIAVVQYPYQDLILLVLNMILTILLSVMLFYFVCMCLLCVLNLCNYDHNQYLSHYTCPNQHYLTVNTWSLTTEPATHYIFIFKEYNMYTRVHTHTHCIF